MIGPDRLFTGYAKETVEGALIATANGDQVNIVPLMEALNDRARIGEHGNWRDLIDKITDLIGGRAVVPQDRIAGFQQLDRRPRETPFLFNVLPGAEQVARLEQ